MATVFMDLCPLSSVTNYDTKIYFYDKNQKELYSNDDSASCVNLQSQLTITELHNGSYIIGVGGFHENYGDYTMNIVCIASLKPKTMNPTANPIKNPTVDPTNKPTPLPLISPPKKAGCGYFGVKSTNRTIDLIVLNDISSGLGENNICDIYVPITTITQNNKLKRVRIGELMEFCMELNLNPQFVTMAESIIRVGKWDDQFYPGISVTGRDIIFKISELNTTNGTGNITVNQYVWENVLNIGNTKIWTKFCVELSHNTLEATYDNMRQTFSVNAHKTDNTSLWFNTPNTLRMPVYAGDYNDSSARTTYALPPINGTLRNLCLKTSRIEDEYKPAASTCWTKQDTITKTIKDIKVADDYATYDPFTNVRIAYIEYDCNDAYLTKGLDRDLNKKNVSEMDLINEFNDIKNRNCGDGTENICGKTTNLCAALDLAFNEFNTNIIDADPNREKAILIYSNNINDESNCNICKFEHHMYGRQNGAANIYGVSVMMVNINLNITNKQYKPCLVKYDNQRILDTTIELLTDQNYYEYYVADVIQMKLCDTKPSLSPTIDPTTDPTINPTISTLEPTVNPSTDPTSSPSTEPTIYPTLEPTIDPTPNPTGSPTESPSVSPTFNPTNYSQYNDPKDSHFHVIYELRELTDNNIQTIIVNIFNFAEILSRIIESSYVETSMSNDLDSKYFWVKVKTINYETVEQLHRYNQEYLKQIFGENNAIRIEVIVECNDYHCAILDKNYKENPFVNMTENKLKKYFEIATLNAEINNDLEFVVISSMYNMTELKINETIWQKYLFALVVGGIIIFIFCIGILIYKHITKEKPIFMSNVLVAIISISFYDSSNEIEKEVDAYCSDLYAPSRDMENLKKLFKSLNYTVMTNKDKLEWNASEIKQFLEIDVVNELINNTQEYDGLIVSVSSHGLRDNIITSSYEKVDKTALHRMISKWRTDEKHKRIRDIPRIFIFDACSGELSRQRTTELDKEQTKGIDEKYNGNDTAKGIEYKSGKNEWGNSDKNPDYNLLKIDGANTGFQAFSDNAKGSYLITSFVEKIQHCLETNNYQVNKPLINIFLEIQDELHDKGKQLIQINPSGKMIKYVSLKRNDMYRSNVMKHASKSQKLESKKSLDTDDDDEQQNDNNYQESIVQIFPLQPLKSTQL